MLSWGIVSLSLLCGFATKVPKGDAGPPFVAEPPLAAAMTVESPPGPVEPARSSAASSTMPSAEASTEASTELSVRLAAGRPDGSRDTAFPIAGTAHDWQVLHGRVDPALWRYGASVAVVAAGSSPRGAGMVFHDSDFPLLDGTMTFPEGRGRRWTPLIKWSGADGSGDRQPVPVPYVRCMGLSPEAVARRASRIEAQVRALAIEHGVSPSLVKAVIAAESCFDPQAVSRAGAIGLMQLMPATAEWLGVPDPTEEVGNLRGGIRYFASLQAQFGDTELALAAYNAGPGNVRRHGGIPPFAETRAYVKKVLSFHRRYAAATRMASR